MTKVASRYPSVTRGVSEQVPSDRLPGQHWEQVNMVSDPRRGVARRHGSVTLDEKRLGAAEMAPSPEDTRGYREYSFVLDGTEYSLLYQSSARPGTARAAFCYCLNKTTGKFLDVKLCPSAQGGLEPWQYGGVSAVTAVGRYLVIAATRGHQTPDPNHWWDRYRVEDPFRSNAEFAAVWVRGGAYSRTFRITVKHEDGATYTAEYTTPSSSYPHLLDTSDIVQEGNAHYAKQVSDRVNAYNSAVNRWLGQAQASVQPQAIARQLADMLRAQGYYVNAQHGSTLLLNHVASVSVDDSGDGSLLRVVHDEVDDPAKLSTVHYHGKVVRVQPRGVGAAYYMRAVLPSAPKVARGDWGPVTWTEGARRVIQPRIPFAVATITADGKTLIVSDSPRTLATETGLDVPGYSASQVGEGDDVPYFLKHAVTALTVFMDRLVIVSDGAVFMSRTGDYFNWFRRSALRQDADDPIEAYALGAEDDVIRHTVTYNKDLFLFGERNQYTISGRAALTPGSIAITTTAGERGAAGACPVVVGNLLFYGKAGVAPDQTGPSPYAASLAQFQPGLFESSPETYVVSQQLDRYLRGRPLQLATLASPHTVLLRTDGNDYGLYVYRFIDQPDNQARVFASWSRWEWSPLVGRILGMTTYQESLYVYTLRAQPDGQAWIACEQFPLATGLSVRPYLDAQRSPGDYQMGTGFLAPTSVSAMEGVYVAAGMGSEAALLGAPIAQFRDFYTRYLWGWQREGAVGVGYEGRLQLTAPYIRDPDGVAVLSGRLVVSRYTLTLTETAGMDAYRSGPDGEVPVYHFSGGVVGASANLVGRQPVVTTAVSVPCGRANTEHRLTLRTRHWLPLTVSAVEWTGQLFNNTRRV